MILVFVSQNHVSWLISVILTNIFFRVFWLTLTLLGFASTQSMQVSRVFKNCVYIQLQLSKKKKGILKRQPRTSHRQPILMCRQNKNWEPGRLKFENNFLLTFLGLDRGSACTPAGVSSRRSCMCCGSSYYLSRMGVSVSVNTVRCVRALSKNWQFFWRLVVSMIDMWDYYSLATVKVLIINLSHY